MKYVQVAGSENSKPIEIPTEEDGTLLQSTLVAQYPNVIGIKYVTPDGRIRGLRLVDNKFYPPEEGWGDSVYICSFPAMEKRKYDGDDNSDGLKRRNDGEENLFDRRRNNGDLVTSKTEIIIRGLSPFTNENDLYNYFGQFGTIKYAQVVHDTDTGASKRFAFVNFLYGMDQNKVLSQEQHVINGQVCQIRAATNQDLRAENPDKIFVGRITQDMTREDFANYFSQFGLVRDVFIPEPFKGYAFVTFGDDGAMASLKNREHTIRNRRVMVSEAYPKNKMYNTAVVPNSTPYRPTPIWNHESKSRNDMSLDPAIITEIINRAVKEFIAEYKGNNK